MCVAAIDRASIACSGIAGVRMTDRGIVPCNWMRRTPSQSFCLDRRFRLHLRRTAAQSVPQAAVAVSMKTAVAGMVAWMIGVPPIDVTGAKRRTRLLRTNRAFSGVQAPRCRQRG